ncbi:hypothetical protein RHSIM_Rhsim11G0085100 [Rhododendron simsii]|uniref:Uncharacterized protein n=1 Tax=Rhododendron simsii TaxID=118357 RepID=A0A834GA46_RHOSS|nr:hypothetical protein RHSIM_Rhsim11G0085100 [Rhododendron simsii]
MAEEKHHHHFFGHHKDEDKPVDVDAIAYSDTTFTSDGMGNDYTDSTTVVVAAVDEPAPDYEKERREHKSHEHLGELGAIAAGAFALHEKHKAEKDPEHAYKHKLEEEIAAAAAVGAGGYAFHEHHEKKEAKAEEKEAEGKKHHLF